MLKSKYRSKDTDVKSVIKSLATNKAPGYDKISARVPKDSCQSIAPVISRLVNNSFKMAAFPKEWKIAKWYLYPKKETQKNQLTTGRFHCYPSYRKWVRDWHTSNLWNFWRMTYQRGNRKIHSTETAPINVRDNILKAIYEKSASLLVLFDMLKTSDSLS